MKEWKTVTLISLLLLFASCTVYKKECAGEIIEEEGDFKGDMPRMLIGKPGLEHRF